jgi:hypothetical protein
MKNIIALFIISMLVFGASSCKSNPLWSAFENIDDESNAAPGRRDYTWTTDTLKIPFTSIFDMWGDAADNVWAVGPGGDLDKTIYRYDGSKWSTDGISRAIAPMCVYGFGKNDIWAGGNFGSLWHYNGSTWTKKYQISIAGYDNYIIISDIYGDSPNDIYAIGYTYKNDEGKGFIYHYDGLYWSRVYLADYTSQFLRIGRGKSENSNYYIFYATTNSDSCSIAEFDGKSFKQIHTSIWDNNNVCIFQCFNNRIYFICGDGVYKYWYGNFINIVKISNTTNFGQGILARSSKDILFFMYDGIAHYNGSNIEYLLRGAMGAKMYFRSGVIFENDVFILEVPYQGLNIIHHGKLKMTEEN